MKKEAIIHHQTAKELEVKVNMLVEEQERKKGKKRKASPEPAQKKTRNAPKKKKKKLTEAIESQAVSEPAQSSPANASFSQFGICSGLGMLPHVNFYNDYL